MLYKPTRRDILKYGGIAAASAAIPQTKYLPFHNIQNADVISPSNLTYKGMFKVPNIGGNLHRFATSDGSGISGYITGRRRAGVSTLLLQNGDGRSGAPGYDHLSEVTIPDESLLTNNPNTTATCSVLGTWTCFPCGVWYTPNQGPPDNNAPVITGISYIGDRGHGEEIVFTWGSSYGDPGGNFRNIGLAVLNDDYTSTNNGPWGSNTGWTNNCASFFSIPSSIRIATGCGAYGLVAGINGGQTAIPAGASLLTCDLPAFTDPPDGPTDHSITMRYAVFYGRQTAQARPLGTTDGVYAAYSGAPNELWNESLGGCGSGIRAERAYQPFFGGYNPGTWDGEEPLVDWVNDGIIIDGASRKGVIFNGHIAEAASIAKGFTFDDTYGGWKLVSGNPTRTSAYTLQPNHCQIWYGSNVNCYGHYSTQNAASGPGTDSLVGWGFIMSFADIISNLNGDAVSSKSMSYSFRYFQRYGLDPLYQLMTYLRQYRTYYDSAAKRIYMVEQQRVADNSDRLPVIHVIAVDC